MTERTTASPEARIDAFCEGEFARWRDRPVDRGAFEAEMHRLNGATHGVYLFEVDGANIELLPKPDSFRVDMLRARAETYCGFFREVLRRAPIHARFLLPVETGDQPLNSPFPTLSFQKHGGDPTILINDVNIIEADFYERVPYVDDRRFADKLDKAVFVGSTSGLTNTMATLEAGGNARIEAARFFKDDPRVDFWLPNVVQADAEAEAAIRAMGLGNRIVGWDEQLGYKLLLSLDGNGAACQRLAVALKSHSAVVKYESPSILYYFGALEPWVHFVPVASNEEVLRLFDEGLGPRFEEIAETGRTFFEETLTREPSMAYAAMVLTEYARLFA